MKERWEIKRLGEVSPFDKVQGNHRDLPYVGLEHIESHTARFIGSHEVQLVKSSTFRFSNEHVLYGRLRPYLNKALAPNFEGHCSTEIFPLRPSPKLSREFLLYWLLSDGVCDKINATCTGARMPRAQMNAVMDFPIPVPPLSEQHRIVGILDEAFAGLATAQANAKKNLQNARAVFESHLNDVFSKRGEGWVEKTLGEAYDVRDGTHDSPKYHTTGYPLITSKNLKPDGLSFDDVKLINEADFNKINERSAVHRGDVLFAMIGTIGNPTLVEIEPRFAIKNVALFKVPAGQNSRFLKHYLDSEQVKSKMAKEAKGTTQKFVGLGYLRSFPILLPAQEMQNDIVGELDTLSAETRRLAAVYERKLAELEALKKSLLHQAFAGAL